MRIFVAGATGVLGSRLVPLLVGQDHEVAGMTRSPGKTSQLARLGAIPIVCDVFDGEALEKAVVGFRPDAVIHQLTDLPDNQADIHQYLPLTARIRTEGTTNLVRAAHRAGATRIVAQSVAWLSAAPIAFLEAAVLQANGVVLRYGQWYGPGTYFEEGELPPPPRVHIDTAAQRTGGALGYSTGVYTITDSQPG